MRKCSPAIFATISLGVAFFLHPSQAKACSCGITTAEEAYSLYDVIFRGEVVSVEEVEFSYPNGSFSEYEVSFRVQESWKGVEERYIKVYAPIGDCSFDSFNMAINIGDPWLVFAEDQSEFFDGYLIFHICTRSRLLQNGQPNDIPVLNSLAESTTFPDDPLSANQHACGNVGLLGFIFTIATIPIMKQSRHVRLHQRGRTHLIGSFVDHSAS